MQIIFNFGPGDHINGVEISFSYDIKLTNPEYNRVWMKLKSNLYEKIYGLGEQFTYLNLKGKRHTVWTREQGKLSSPVYFQFDIIVNKNIDYTLS